jgi:hypothetical protein
MERSPVYLIWKAKDSRQSGKLGKDPCLPGIYGIGFLSTWTAKGAFYLHGMDGEGFLSARKPRRIVACLIKKGRDRFHLQKGLLSD